MTRYRRWQATLLVGGILLAVTLATWLTSMGCSTMSHLFD